MAFVPAELLVPGLLFLAYSLVVWLAVRVLVGEWISVPLAMLTVIIAGVLQLLVLFGIETSGIPSPPLWFRGGLLEVATWFVSVKAMVRCTFYRALLISLSVVAVTWIFRAFGLDWSLGPVMLGVAKLVGHAR